MTDLGFEALLVPFEFFCPFLPVFELLLDGLSLQLLHDLLSSLAFHTNTIKELANGVGSRCDLLPDQFGGDGDETA